MKPQIMDINISMQTLSMVEAAVAKGSLNSVRAGKSHKFPTVIFSYNTSFSTIQLLLLFI